MAACNKVILLASTAITAASTTTDVAGFGAKTTDVVGFVKATAVNAATTVSTKLQHSPNGVDWFDLATFTAIAGSDGAQIVTITTPVLSQVRAIVTLSGTTKAASVAVELYTGQ